MKSELRQRIERMLPGGWFPYDPGRKTLRALRNNCLRWTRELGWPKETKVVAYRAKGSPTGLPGKIIIRRLGKPPELVSAIAPFIQESLERALATPEPKFVKPTIRDAVVAEQRKGATYSEATRIVEAKSPTSGHRRQCGICGASILCQYARGALPLHKTPAGHQCNGYRRTDLNPAAGTTQPIDGADPHRVTGPTPVRGVIPPAPLPSGVANPAPPRPEPRPEIAPEPRPEIAPKPLQKDTTCLVCGYGVKLTDKGVMPVHYKEDASWCEGSNQPPGFVPGENGVGGKARPVVR